MKVSFVLSALLLWPASAWARGEEADGDAKQQCASAYEKAQELKLDNRLIKAREQLLTCMADPCPQVAKSHCAEWLVEVERAIPTVVLSFVDESGTNRSDVAVTVDGEPLTQTLDGQALKVDPGPHTFVFTPSGATPVERRVTVAEGERNVKIDVSLAKPDASKPEPNPAATGDAAASEGPGFPVVPLVLGGLTLVGFGLFAGFGASALVTGNKCKPTCSDEQVDDVTTKALVADISLGVGAAALVGTIIAVVVMSNDDEAAAARWRLQVGAAPSGAGLTLGAWF